MTLHLQLQHQELRLLSYRVVELRTLASVFRLLVINLASATSKKQSSTAELICIAKLLLWDEAPNGKSAWLLKHLIGPYKI